MSDVSQEPVLYQLFITSGFVLAFVSSIFGQPKAGPPTLPDANIVDAWEKAGAEHGSIDWSESQTRRMFSRSRPAEKAGEVPAFLIDAETKLATLKEPAVPFGIVLRKQVSDEQLKTLSTFENLQYILAYGQPLTSAAAKDLARQKNLRYLDLGRSMMTAAGMKDLARLPALETLHVDSIKVTNDGLRELVKIRTLRDLNLDEAGVTYDGLAPLGDLQNLETLGLLGVTKALGKPEGFGGWVKKLSKLRVFRTSRLTDSDLKYFADISTLRELKFEASEVTDAGMKELNRVKDLEVLSLGGAKLSNAGFKELASFKKLRQLVLFRSNITDADLQAFTSMTSLRELSVGDTKVTEAGTADLKKALPELKITR